MYVIKRDGRQVPFDTEKIETAITKAYWEEEYFPTHPLHPNATEIAKKIKSINKDMSVEAIQDLVEKELMAVDPETAKKYILYRNKRSKAREQRSRIFEMVRRRLDATNIQNSNANVDENSFSGREKESASDIHKIYALDNSFSEEVTNAHKAMLIYQHDLEKASFGVHNCLNLDVKRIFENGFETRNGDVRPPSSCSTAEQLLAVAFQCQSQVQFGGVGTVHIDYDIAPFVRKSFRKHVKHYLTDVEFLSEEKANEIIAEFEKDCGDISIDNKDGFRSLNSVLSTDCYNFALRQLDREMRQSAEAFYHNLNTLESRAGSQVPFTSINFGRDTSTEGRMVSKSMLNASLAGIGKHHRTSIFPISIFQYKQGCNANEGDPNYDLKQLALTSLSKRIYPNFCNCDWSQAHEDPSNPDTFFSTMGCRTMLGFDRHGMGYTRVGRGNNVPVTIILPQLGIKNGVCLGEREEPNLDQFWKDFEETLLLAEQALLERFDVMICQRAVAAPFMYKNGTIADADKCVESVYSSLKHNTLAIGYIGIAEMCQALFGENHVHNKKAHAFALSVVQRINEFAKEASERNDLNFSCYATPKISDWVA